MEKKSTCQLDFTTKNRLEFVGKCMKVRKNQIDSFYPQQYIINRLIDEYLDKIDVEPLKPDITDKSLNPMNSFLKSKRIDVDLPKTTKDDLKALSNIMLEKKMIDKKLNYNDIIQLLLNKFLELYPELKDGLIDYKYIKQKMALQELRQSKDVRR